jgi:zinc/manganese transport system substrate-binding protein
MFPSVEEVTLTSRRPRPRRFSMGVGVVVCLAVLVSACSTASDVSTTSSTSASSSGRDGAECAGATGIKVVVAENFWGSIAIQLGGHQVEVTSIISNPDTDPHDYEATADDGRTVASAQYVIQNGIGYDPWVGKLADANPDPDRKLLDIGASLGLKEGDNPHRWYFPGDVATTIDHITSDYKAIEPSAAACFDRLNHDYKANGLRQYNALLAEIRQRYAGTPVGASESIFAGLADAVGLKLVTPASFLDATSEGNDPTAADKAAVDRQIKDNEIKVFVFNSQNSTPDVQTLIEQAKAKGIPISTVTETLTPEGATFQDWQSRQLQSLLDALDGKGPG